VKGERTPGVTPTKPTVPRRRSGMRLRGLIRKEFLQVLRDPSSIAIAFVMPVILLLLFGYGVSLDAKHVPLALVVEQASGDTASFTGAFQQSQYFRPIVMANIRQAEQALLQGRVNGIVRLREDFSRRLRGAGAAPIQVIVNGVNANDARLIEGYVQGVWVNWLEDLARARGDELNMPVRLEQRVWFNSELRSRNYLVPGLIAVIMTLIGALLTAMVMAREWERGTMEALMVTPVAMREVLLGKLIPYFLLGMGGYGLVRFHGGLAIRGAVTGIGCGAHVSRVAIPVCRSGDGPVDLNRCQEPVCGRPSRHHRYLFAGIHSIGFYLRYRQHAAGHTGAHAFDCRALFRFDPANSVSCGRHLVGVRAQCVGAGCHGGFFSRIEPSAGA
jgi:hypothetical protein